jgi:hypothetical protein
LLRRGFKQIIVVVEAEDPDYRMDDLCSPHNQLQAAPVKRSIFIQGLKNFPGDCGKSGNPFGLEDRWPAPILLGSVCRGDVPCDGDPIAARLFIIKPALNRQARTGKEMSLSELIDKAWANVALDRCERKGDADRPFETYPCEVIGFMRDNGNTNLFPQHSTIRMTASSSPYLYGAYRELGRYYANYLHIADGQLTTWSPWNAP